MLDLRPRLTLLKAILQKCNDIEAKMNLILAGDKLKTVNQALTRQEESEKIGD